MNSASAQVSKWPDGSIKIDLVWAYGNQMPDVIQIYEVDPAGSEKPEDAHPALEMETESDRRKDHESVDADPGKILDVWVYPRVMGDDGKLADRMREDNGEELPWERFGIKIAAVRTPGTPPPPPQGLPAPAITGTQVGVDSVQLTWSAPRSYPRYHIWWQMGPQSLAQVDVDAPGAGGSWNFENLQPSTSYSFKVQGVVPHPILADECSPWSQTVVVQTHRRVYTPAPPAAGNPVLIQSRFGKLGNFEVVAPMAGGGFAHFWRENDKTGMPWHGPQVVGQQLGRIDGLSMIQSNYEKPGNLEVFCVAGGVLQEFWRDCSAFAWHGPVGIAPGFAAAGNPVLIQSRFGKLGNFEVVVPAAGGGFAHFWRENDKTDMPWHGPQVVGQQLGRIDGLSMIQSNYEKPGNLEVFCVAGGVLQEFWRDCSTFTWRGPVGIAPGFAAVGNPVLIQSRFGKLGNFEVVVPAAGGGFAHFWRDNDKTDMPWHGPQIVGQQLGRIDGLSMIQSNYEKPGNLEVFCVAGGVLQEFWRDCSTFTWHGPYPLYTTP